MDITLNIAKNATFNEVSKITSFIGAKIPTEAGSLYEQVAVTNDDFHVLEKFWREAIGTVVLTLKRFHKESTAPGVGSMVDLTEVFSITLQMPIRFDATLTGSLESALSSFFINYVTSKWLPITYRADTEYYQKEAASNMAEILTKIFHKTYPKRA